MMARHVYRLWWICYLLLASVTNGVDNYHVKRSIRTPSRATQVVAVVQEPQDDFAFMGDSVTDDDEPILNDKDKEDEELSEYMILTVFFNATSGPRWKNSNGWTNSEMSPCRWYGIRCNREGFVSKIDLTNNRVIGAVPVQTFRLPYLKELRLGNNYLAAFSFNGIGFAQSLELLDISGNNLGNLVGISHVPPTLHTLHVERNSLRELTAELFELFYVDHLYLGHNEIEGTLPTEVGNLKGLKVLDLSENKLTGTLPSELGRLLTMEELYLGDNYWTGNLPPELDNLKELSMLSLNRGTKNAEEGGKTHVLTGPLPPFPNLAQLVDLELDGNSLTGHLPLQLLKNTAMTTAIVTINLRDNEFSGKVPRGYAERFDRLTLDLTGNRIEEIPSVLCEKQRWMGGDVGIYGCDAILCPNGTANPMGRQTTVESYCAPCLKDNEGIPNVMGRTSCGDTTTSASTTASTPFSEREVLGIFFDAMAGPTWKNSTHWKDEDVDHCLWEGVVCRWEAEQLKSRGIDDADAAVTRQRHLSGTANSDDDVIGLILVSNGLSGTFPPSLYFLRSLLVLDLSRNSIQFSFESIDKATSLISLSLFDTGLLSIEGLDGAIGLRDLDLSQNELKGTLPTELTTLTGLHRLDIGFNFLTGKLPGPAIGEGWKELRRLSMYANKFTGPIPTEFGLLSKLSILDLAENDFTGTLSATAFSKLDKLQELILHQNSKVGPGISGPLPDFATLPLLQNLYLDHNSLTGKIPLTFLSGIADKTQKVNVGLAFNKLVGTVPAALESFDILNLDLTNNSIVAISSELCNKTNWMHGMVASYGCDAILCPKGTYNGDGKRFDDGACLDCPSTVVMGSTACDEDPERMHNMERDALEHLYYATGGRRWDQGGNWTTPWMSVCEWRGIACNSVEMVESINLSNVGLAGTIPTQIFLLPGLTTLRLGGNEIDFQENFGGFELAHRLRILDLSDTGLTSVVGLIEKLPQLFSLDLSQNSLEGPYPASLTTLKELTYLDVSSNNLSGTLPESMASLIKLKVFKANSNHLTTPLPNAFGNMNELEVLELADNDLYGPIPLVLTDHMNHLEKLDLSAQHGDDDNGFVGTLPDFHDFKYLSYLGLASNSLTGTIPSTLLDQSIILKKEVTVDLAHNNIVGMIPFELARFDNMNLVLVDNRINRMPNELCDANHTQWMGGRVGQFGCDAILCPRGTSTLFGYQTGMSLADSCQPCANYMEALFMGSPTCASIAHIANLLETKILTELYEKTGGLRWTKRTNWTDDEAESDGENVNTVGICNWYGVVCQDRFKSDDDKENVVELRLPSNNLVGTLPSNVFKLPVLRVLDLSNNDGLHISLDGIENSKRLEALILPNTQMTSIDGIRSAYNLKRINFAGNHIDGPIPSDIYDLRGLTSMIMSNNNFSGKFDRDKFKQIPKLQIMHWRNNQLSGNLPLIAIRDQNSMTSIDLSGNQFEGKIPRSWTLMKELQFIDLSNNLRLSGSVPDFSDLPRLTTLNLANNAFNGTIPSTLLANSEVKLDQQITIDLTNNSMSGPIPSELSDFYDLNLHLVGNVPGFNDLPSILCEEGSGHDIWLNGNVGAFKCAAILCPPGSSNPKGRQESPEEPCVTCENTLSSLSWGSKQCHPPTEGNILKLLYSSTNGDEWAVSTNWNNDEVGVCNWHGITCAVGRPDDDGMVTKIELNNLDDTGIGAVGKIPSQIFSLPNLKVLNLKGNKVSIDFTEIETINYSIELLYMSETNLANIFGISILKGLKILHLTDIGLNDDIEEIFQLVNLEEAYLSYNHFVGSLEKIGQLKKLEKFFAINNNLSGSIPLNVGLIENLNTFVLSGNFITGRIPRAMNTLSNLEVFANLNTATRGPGLTGGLPTFAKTKLNTIILNHNSLTGSIPENFVSGTSTTEDMLIWLPFNRLTGSIPAALGRFAFMDLELSGNELTELPSELCDEDNAQWMGNNVDSFGCDAILCPIGYFNKNGKQKGEGEPCELCTSEDASKFLGSTQCVTTTERLVLEKLYNATGGDNWKNKQNWLSSDQGICNWYGIHCESGFGDSGVTEISLQNNGLEGRVPHEIFSLQSLKYLNLESNHITIVFAQLEEAISLTDIVLARTDLLSLSGISRARRLKNLHIDSIGLFGSIPDELYTMKSLEVLHADNNSFHGSICSDIGNLVNLRGLFLLDNNLDGTLPSELGLLSNLENLNLAENDFTGTFPDEIENLENLKTVFLYHSVGVGGGLHGPIPTFFNARNIEKLYLNYNTFSGPIPTTFLQNVVSSGTQKNPVDIDLSWNQLTGSVPLTLDHFTALNINLVGNLISSVPLSLCDSDNELWMDGGVKEFACDAILCPVGYANDYGREIVGNPCEPCPSDSYTPFAGSMNCVLREKGILMKLYDTCGGTKWYNKDGWSRQNDDVCKWDGITCGTDGKVNALLLGSNNLKGTIPTEIFDLPELSTLWLYSNDVHFNFEGISRVRKLESLLLDSTKVNNIDGISGALRLKELGLRFNDMTGIIPNELSKLKNIEALALSDNDLVGPLPQFLEKMKKLKKLRLGSNRLAGPLLEFADHGDLYAIDLSDNRLSGTIPGNFLEKTRDSGIIVDLSSNRISGTIPPQLGRLNRMTLNVRNNRIEGISPGLCFVENWNDGTVKKFGCDAILCPPGSFNEQGRMTSTRMPCVRCDTATFYGATSCTETISTHASAQSQISEAPLHRLSLLNIMVIMLPGFFWSMY